MTTPTEALPQLNRNLLILREREAKFGGNAPLELLNQIDDHVRAIDLTEQAIAGDLSPQDWHEALRPLLLANGQIITIEAGTYVAGNMHGDIFTGDKIIYEAPAPPLPPAEARERHDLGILLKNVDTTWIKGVLEHSVHQAALLDLGLETRADAVDHPWHMVLEAPDQARQVLPPSTQIKTVFDEANQLLLILGEPGSGKTTTLLQLARDLIAQVDPAFGRPVPVIFNLSTWTEPRQPLADWLSAELNSKYRTPKKQGRRWLETRRILPLFDGLDEVKPDNRAACVERINRLAVDVGLPGVVVCSRLKDYTVLAVRLQFNRAIVLQALTAEQIDAYFDRAGPQLAGLRAALQRDEALHGLAQSPLMLNIMSLAYQDRSADALSAPELDTDDARRRHLFETYIARMFTRKGDRLPYDAHQTKARLAWLARNMQRHNQEVFLIEGLQPSWLPDRRWRVVYVLASRLLGWLSFGLIIGLIIELIDRLSDGLSFGLSIGLFFGLPVSFIDLLRFEWWDKRRYRTVVPPFWWSVINITIVGLIYGLIVGLIGGLSIGLSDGLSDGLIVGLIVGLSFGLFVGPSFGLLFGLRGSRQSLDNDIQTVEALRWSWSKALKGGLIGALSVGLSVGLSSGLLVWVSGGPSGG